MSNKPDATAVIGIGLIGVVILMTMTFLSVLSAVAVVTTFFATMAFKATDREIGWPITGRDIIMLTVGGILAIGSVGVFDWMFEKGGPSSPLDGLMRTFKLAVFVTFLFVPYVIDNDAYLGRRFVAWQKARWGNDNQDCPELAPVPTETRTTDGTVRDFFVPPQDRR